MLPVCRTIRRRKMKIKQLVIGVVMALTPTVAMGQTCDYPWPTSGQYPADMDKPFEVGRYYRHPYTQVIEILGKVCFAYDTLVDEDGNVVDQVCADEKLAYRHAQGRVALNPPSLPKKSLVWFDGRNFLYPSGYLDVNRPVREWGKLPEGCLVPSTVVMVEQGRVVIKY